MSVIDDCLSQLRAVFHVWDHYDDEYDLLQFAYYEGCDEPIMAIAAPYAVGHSLVKTFGFQWVMIRVQRIWHHGVYHPLFTEPIDLTSLEQGEWYRPDAQSELPEPGEITLDSLDVIILALKWKQVKGADMPIPDGSVTELEHKVNRASILG